MCKSACAHNAACNHLSRWSKLSLQHCVQISLRWHISLQDKTAAEDRADLAETSHTSASIDDAADSPRHASHLAQPSDSMPLSDAAIAANVDAELSSLAATFLAPAEPSEGSMQAPDTPQAPSSGGIGASADANFGSTMLSMSSQTLSALPTPTHPSAIPPATAQALNNELGRSLLQVPLQPGQAAFAASPRSERLTSAYSGILSLSAYSMGNRL